MALAFGGFDGPGIATGDLADVAEANLDPRDRGLVGQACGHVRTGPGLLELVERGEVDQLATRGELVDAQGLQSRARDLGGGDEAGRARADDDDVVGGCVHEAPLIWRRAEEGKPARLTGRKDAQN